ncbi:MAG: hypothetical protein ACKOES_04915, partial [Planctomycetaceae bacterium]
MKFRTCLLAVCMVIVPTVAMFSHLIPAGTRRSVRDCVMTWWTTRAQPTAVTPTSAARDPIQTVPGEPASALVATAKPGGPAPPPPGPDPGVQPP